jgi:hypothetical protein
MTTRVVNVRDYKPYNKYWTKPPTDPYVYIGRSVRFQILFSSKWGNPFKIEKINGKEVPRSREKVMHQYREYILNQPKLLKLIPTELKDKTLGCWCFPLKCHGDILVKLADNS